MSVDGPHGGLRNVTGGDEQFLMFNLTNMAALRDNIRQSAVELVLLAHVLQTLTLDASGCPEAEGAGDVTLEVPDGGARWDHVSDHLPVTVGFAPAPGGR